MESKKAIRITSFSVLAICFIAVAFALYVLYDDISNNSVKSANDLEAIVLVSNIRERMKNDVDPSGIDVMIKNLATIPQNISRKEELSKLVSFLKGLKSNAKSVTHNQISKLQGALLVEVFNFYRQQVVRRNLGVASHLSNILNDAHQTFAKEWDSTVITAFIQRSYGKLTRLENTVGSRTTSRAIESRLAQVRRSYKNLEDKVNQMHRWELERERVFAKISKITTVFKSTISKSRSANMSRAQQNFIFMAVISVICFVAAIFFIFYLSNLAGTRFRRRYNVLVKYLQEFSNFEKTTITEAEFSDIRSSKDWRNMFETIQDVESEYISGSAAELSLGRSILNAFIVLTDAQEAVFWNSFAVRLLGLQSKDEIESLEFDALFENCGGLLGRSNENVLPALREGILNSRDGNLDVFLNVDGKKTAVQISLHPIRTGPLENGTILMFKELKEFSARVEREVDRALEPICAFVDGLLESSELPELEESAFEQANSLIGGLKKIRIRWDESEALWSEQTTALRDQLSRESSLIEESIAEIKFAKESYEDLKEITSNIRGSASDMSKHRNQANADIENLKISWKKLKQIVQETDSIAERASEYEERVKRIVGEMKTWMEGLRPEMDELRACKEWIKLHSVNLSLLDNNSKKEFVAKSRVFVGSVSDFCTRVEKLENELDTFIRLHPGSASFKHIPDLIGSGIKIAEEVEAIHQSFSEELILIGKLGQNIIDTETKNAMLLNEVTLRNSDLDKINNTCHQLNNGAMETLLVEAGKVMDN